MIIEGDMITGEDMIIEGMIEGREREDTRVVIMKAGKVCATVAGATAGLLQEKGERGLDRQDTRGEMKGEEERMPDRETAGGVKAQGASQHRDGDGEMKGEINRRVMPKHFRRGWQMKHLQMKISQ